MQIYEAEKHIEDKILASTTATYHAAIQKFDDNDALKNVLKSIANNQKYKSFAALEDPDLYITKSILVSTNWNLNDDIFLPHEVWAARHTPLHKPTNLNHDETELVGHITANWAIDNGGDIIPDDTDFDDLPEFFHICNAAVIYLRWDDPDLEARAAKLVEEIEAGTKYVSMECRFPSFDYALKKGDDISIVARDKSTAFLTSKLKWYGGDGTYEGYSVGRVLRNITFSGKGYVDQPGNPHSIILNDFNVDLSKASVKNNFFSESGVLNNDVDNKNQEVKKMSEISQTQYDSVVADLKEALASVKSLEKQVAEANIKGYEEKISELEGTVAAYKDKEEKMKKEKKDDETKASELESTIQTLTDEKAALASELDGLKSEAEKNKRVATLVEGGYEKEEAVARVEKFASLDDEAFAAIASDLVEAKRAIAEMSKKDDKKDKKDDEAKASDGSDEDTSSAGADALETVDGDNTTEDSASAGIVDGSEEGEENEVAKAFASLASVAEENFTKKNN